VPSERAEIQVRSDRATGGRAGESMSIVCTASLSRSLGLAAGCSGRGTPALPHRHPHQTKQDSFKGGKSCNASPFFKIEGAAARRSRALLRAGGRRHTLCPAAHGDCVRRSAGATSRGRGGPRCRCALNTAHGASGRVDIWLNGAFCGAYQGPMADRDYGARRNGAPFINAQPRLASIATGARRPRRSISDKIMFWNADPAGHPDWNMSPPPG